MDLETIIQSEVSQKEKNVSYNTALHMKSRKMIWMNLFICKAETETQIWRTNLGHRVWGEKVWIELEHWD